MSHTRTELTPARPLAENTDKRAALSAAEIEIAEKKPMPDVIHVVFDGSPSHESGRFVEVETPDGRGIRVGEWQQRPNGLWQLVIPIGFGAGYRAALEDAAKECESWVPGGDKIAAAIRALTPPAEDPRDADYWVLQADLALHEEIGNLEYGSSQHTMLEKSHAVLHDWKEPVPEAREEVKRLQYAIFKIWEQLEPGKANLSDPALTRANIGSIVMSVQPNNPPKPTP